MIPKIIHQTWKTREIPLKWQKAVESCKTLHPNYEYRLWTDETMTTFMQTTYACFYPTYQNYKHPIQRCDAFRYFVLYTYGGIYLDLDIECKQKLEPLLLNDLVLSKSANISTSYTNSFLMAAPQHPFMRYCFEHLLAYKDRFLYLGKHMHIMHSTGPLFLTKMLEKYTKHNNKIVNSYILTQAEFAGDCSVCNETKCHGGVYFKHLVGNSWHSWDSTIYNVLLCHYKKLFLILIGLGVLYKFRFVPKLKRKYRH